MIYVCVPVHNEARTAGLVLWKVRQVFTAFPREYQLLVLDDASTDDTGEVLASYAKVLPMTIVTHRERRGYAKSLEELLRLALQRTDRPKRDCAITLHADFVHSPESVEGPLGHSRRSHRRGAAAHRGGAAGAVGHGPQGFDADRFARLLVPAGHGDCPAAPRRDGAVPDRRTPGLRGAIRTLQCRHGYH